VRAWFDTRLEDTRPLVKDANEHLRGRDALRADVPRIGPGPDAKFCGTALDLLVRMTLRSRGWSAAPSRGALRLQYTHGMDRAVEIAGETADRIAALEPATRSADEVDWGEVVPLRALLARYEQAGRSEFAAGQVAGRLRGVRPTLAATIDTRPSLMSTCIAARRTRTSVARSSASRRCRARVASRSARRLASCVTVAMRASHATRLHHAREEL
jgi:hypothetical protein